MSGAKLWLPAEDNAIRSLFPDYEANSGAPTPIVRCLPASRTRVGGCPAAQALDSKGASIIRRRYATAAKDELLELLPGRTWPQIVDVANRHRLFRDPKPYKPTGVEIVDQIRTRCRELNYSMTDLDKITRSKRYFAKAKWHGGHVHHRAIGRAVKVLFGDLKADWK